MAWGEGFPDVSYLKGQRVPELKPAVTVHGEPLALFALTTEGRVFLALDTWDRLPGLIDVGSRKEYLRHFNATVGASMRGLKGWPNFPANLLYDEGRRGAFLGIMEDLANQLRTSAIAPNETTRVAETSPPSPAELALRYQRFLTTVLDRFMAGEPDSATRPSVGPRNWLPFGAGRAGFSFVWSIVGGNRLRVELYIDVGDRDRNKAFFDRLRTSAEQIEADVGQAITWERLDDKKASRLAIYRDTDVEKFDSDTELVAWAAETMTRFADAIRPRVGAL
jgi:hypothetical protein